VQKSLGKITKGMLSVSLVDAVSGNVFCRGSNGAGTLPASLTASDASIAMPTGSRFRIQVESDTDTYGFKPVSLALLDGRGGAVGGITFIADAVETRSMSIGSLAPRVGFTSESFSFFDLRATDAEHPFVPFLTATDMATSLVLQLQMYAETESAADESSGFGLGLDFSSDRADSKYGKAPPPERNEFKAKRRGGLAHAFASLDRVSTMYHPSDESDMAVRQWAPVLNWRWAQAALGLAPLTHSHYLFVLRSVNPLPFPSRSFPPRTTRRDRPRTKRP
jgi:hypothetical protein